MNPRQYSSPQAKKRRLKKNQPDHTGQPRMLYGIDVSDLEWSDDICECPVYRPSKKEFEDPLSYLQKISPKASTFGICKIVCPLSDSVIPASVVLSKELKGFRFETSVQPLKYGTWATENDKISYYKRGRYYKYGEFETVANQVFNERYSSLGCLPLKKLEREFWEEMAWGENGSTVEYGVNVEGSAFSKHDELGRSKWNLKNFPRLPESTLRHLKQTIPGITEPMLYIGMVFSTFAWHVEDHYLYSINYLHSGAPKTWYGVPGSKAIDFEKVVFDNVYSYNVMPSYEQDGAAKVLSEKTTMLPPLLFLKHQVPVYKVVQMPGEFVITFPRSYHAGFSHGFNCAEAVNFAVGEWLPYGLIAAKHYSFLSTQPIIPFEELLCKEAIHLCYHMRISETSIASSSSQEYSSSQCSIMVSCIAWFAYYRAACRKLENNQIFLEIRNSPLETVICGFCAKDRYLAFIMCHRCRGYPACVYHGGISVTCSQCRIQRSITVSNDMGYLEAAADYFGARRHLLSRYLAETVDLQKEITELYEYERDDGKEASTSATPRNEQLDLISDHYLI